MPKSMPVRISIVLLLLITVRTFEVAQTPKEVLNPKTYDMIRGVPTQTPVIPVMERELAAMQVQHNRISDKLSTLSEHVAALAEKITSLEEKLDEHQESIDKMEPEERILKLERFMDKHEKDDIQAATEARDQTGRLYNLVYGVIGGVIMLMATTLWNRISRLKHERVVNSKLDQLSKSKETDDNGS